MRGAGLLTAACCAAVVVVSIAPARAQSGDVPAWIELLDKQPAGVDRPAWKEQRREAAKKLAASGDKRAVAPLIKLAQNEAFDVIGELAIAGLGTLGDPAAIPVLEKIAADASRDRAQRDLAKKALAKLGAKPATPTPTPPTPTPPTPTPTPPTPVAIGPDTEPEPVVVTPDPGLSTDLLGTPQPIPTTTRWNDEVLAATEQLTFGVGAANLSYDTVRDRYAIDLDAASRYARRLEQAKTAWGFGAGARVIAGMIDPDGDASSRATIVNLDGDAEFRAYTGGGVYGIGRGVLSVQVQYLSIEREMMQDAIKDVRHASDAGVAIGGGYGRVLDVGPRLRVKQLEALLEKARALGRPIDDDLAARLQSAWWETRRDRTAYRQLTATVAILREAGVLLGEPDASTTYALLEVLRDPSFDHRPSGLDVNLQIGEEYLIREDDLMVPEGRTELVMASATVARQLGLASDAVARLDARYRILAGEDDGGNPVPAPWRVAATGRWRRFVHADHGELLGALDVHAELVATDDDRDDTDLGTALGGGVGWTWQLSRASAIRAGAEARVDAGEVFFGASLSASYGFLDGAFARTAP